MTTAAHLKAAREKAGLSQAELARRTGIARELVNVYEQGHNEPSAERYRVLLAACGVLIDLPKGDCDEGD